MASPLKTPKAMEREKLQKRIHAKYQKLLANGLKPTAAERVIIKKFGVVHSTIHAYRKQVENRLQNKASAKAKPA